MRDIVTSRLPFWEDTRLWVLARPLSGFAETFSQYIIEVGPGGGSDRPESDPGAEAVLFVVDGTIVVTIEGAAHAAGAGRLRVHARRAPPGRCATATSDPPPFTGSARPTSASRESMRPSPVIANEREIEPVAMPDTDGAWATTLFVDPADLRHDMHVTIVTLRRVRRSRSPRRT